MPIIPKVGEWWEFTATGLGSGGFVASVVGQHVVFVSETGTRIALMWRDAISSLWTKRADVPTTAQPCSRVGCRREAFLVYERPGVRMEVVCPYHLPRGVKSAFTTHVNTVTLEGDKCPTCEIDGIEVFGELPRGVYDHTSHWNCGLCNAWWITMRISDTQIITNPQLFRTNWASQENVRQYMGVVIPEGFKLKTAVTFEDPLRREILVRILLDKITGHQAKILKPATVYDLILTDSDDLA
jgi:hypothetical protein